MNIKLIIKLPPRVSEAVCFRSLPLSVPSDDQLIWVIRVTSQLAFNEMKTFITTQTRMNTEHEIPNVTR